MFYVLLADGFEEAEAMVPADLLKRAGVTVKTVGVTGETVTSSAGVRVYADIAPEQMDIKACEGVFLPGGMPGMENLYRSDAVKNAVLSCTADGKLVCAICAAPAVLGRLGLLRGKRAVCFPGFEAELAGYIPTDAPVCADGKIITARGAGTVFPFAHAIITALREEAQADAVLAKIQYADLK